MSTYIRVKRPSVSSRRLRIIFRVRPRRQRKKTSRRGRTNMVAFAGSEIRKEYQRTARARRPIVTVRPCDFVSAIVFRTASYVSCLQKKCWKKLSLAGLCSPEETNLISPRFVASRTGEKPITAIYRLLTTRYNIVCFRRKVGIERAEKRKLFARSFRVCVWTSTVCFQIFSISNRKELIF